MLDLATSLGAHCLVVMENHGSLIFTMFLAGLIGSVTHCAGMCGPLVAAQSIELAAARKLDQGQAWRRLAGGALLPYQFGRTTTYMMLGSLAALPVSAGSERLSFTWLSPLLLWAAAAIFLWQGLVKLDAIPAGFAGRVSAAGTFTRSPAGAELGIMRLLREATRTLMRNPTGVRGYVLGILLGFLPCGLLYGALIAAAGSGDALAATFAMLAFALGTFPLSWAIGYGSRFAASRFRAQTRVPLALLMIFNAVLLAAISLRLL